MKVTWFGGTTLRVHMGGLIVVVDPDQAPAGIDRLELTGGADRLVALAEAGLPDIDPVTWRPRPLGRGIDEVPPPAFLTVGRGTLLIDAPGEPPLLIADVAEFPRFGRWVDGSVIVLFGRQGMLLAEATATLDLARPRLLVLAADEPTVDEAVGRLADHLRDLSFAALEPGLALEV